MTGSSGDNVKLGYVRKANGDLKFVGGAAMARINAVRKSRGKGNRIARPGEKQRAQQLIPSGLSSFERFFAGLLKGEASDFLNNSEMNTWRAICNRLNLPIPAGPIKNCYGDQKQHFSYRASLVIEEARFSIAQGLSAMQRRSIYEANSQDSRQRNSRICHRSVGFSSTMLLLLSRIEIREKTGHHVLTFTKEIGGPFTPEEISNLRQGTVFACVSENLAPTASNAILGCILASNRDEMIKSKSFSVMVFQPVKKAIDSIWQLTAIASLLTEQRKFEACTNKNTAVVPFLLPLLGGKKPTHIKFSESAKGEIVPHEVNNEEYLEVSLFSDEEMETFFHAPRLNPIQEKAALTFLNSQPNTITLIQGPPGTGKTTLLVNIICQYLLQSIKGDRARCLMVCAPSNKAVSVLCTRFLDSLRSFEELPCNIVLVGDDDKLLDDEQSRIKDGQHRSRLRSIFLYTWIRTVLDHLLILQKFVKRPKFDKREIKRIKKQAISLSNRLRQSLSRFPEDIGTALDRLIHLLEIGITKGGVSQREALDIIDALQKEIEGWKSDLIWQDLLGSAHIIFCTLASAGAGILKKSVGQIDDLIVDEAAASSEPELYIPFHFRPERLLAVGDPKQLPATVLSRTAGERGLDKSLHERLMYDSGYPHIMLDTQYRMKPELSRFPSKYFYGGRVLDGSNVVSQNSSGPLLLEGQSYSFLQVNGLEKQSRSGSYENYAEAQAVVNLVQQASRQMSGRWQSADRIRIITFYVAQVTLIKRLLYRCRLSDVLVATVDSSQGSEADIVIVSFVRSHGNSKNESVGFLTDDRRMNVALTRAKNQLICVGNIKRMRSLTNPNAKTVKALAEDALERCCVLSSEEKMDRPERKRLTMDQSSGYRQNKQAKRNKY